MVRWGDMGMSCVTIPSLYHVKCMLLRHLVQASAAVLLLIQDGVQLAGERSKLGSSLLLGK
jgi:hypothetical protein